MRSWVVSLLWIGILACGGAQPAKVGSASRALTAGFTGSWPGVGTHPYLMTRPDGRVAVVSWGSATTFDPSTNTWTAGPQPPTFTNWPCLAPLSGARILMAGGGYTATQIYSTEADSWSYSGNLNQARNRAPCVDLADGRVLIATGLESVSAELYDPSSGTWAPTSAPPHAGHTDTPPVRLLDGRVLFTDGVQPETYDPVSGTFTQVGTPSDNRMAHAAVRLADGRVLVVGGITAAEAGTSAIFDPVTNTYSPAGALVTARYNEAAVLLSDGRVLISGGTSQDGSHSIADCEIYDPGTNTWTATAPLLQAREQHGMIVLPDGAVLVVGGDERTSSSSFNELTGAQGAEVLLPPCQPTSCSAQGSQCGTISDGCGGTVDCGTCAGGGTCSPNNICNCVPTTCEAAGATCGTLADGCGGTLDCGGCAAGLSCNESHACADLTGPTAGITSPVAGEVVSGLVMVKVSAEDLSGVDHVEVYDGTALIGSSNTLPYSVSWDTNGLPGGSHTLTCKAYDTLGNVGTCSAVVVSVPASVSYDSGLGAPVCNVPQVVCDSGELLVGRAGLGPEANAPNTLDGCADGTSGAFHSDESLDRLAISTLDGTPLTGGKMVRIDAQVWAFAASGDSLDLYASPSATSPHFTLIATLPATSAGQSTLSTFYTLPNTPQQVVRGVFRYGGTAGSCTYGGFDDHDDLVFAVQTIPDSEPPAVSITAPADGASVSGLVTVTADATDNVGVSRVDFYGNGTLIGSSTVAPYAITWDSSTAPAPVTLQAKAYDATGNEGQSAFIQVMPKDLVAPTVSIVDPADGAAVAGIASITAIASDASGVARVEFYAGTQWIGTATAPPYAMSWDTSGLSAGSLILTAKAYDNAGNVGTSAPVRVGVGPSAPGGPQAVYDPGFRLPRCFASGASCDSAALLNGRGTLGPESSAPNVLGDACMDGPAGLYHVDESLDRLQVSTIDGSPLSAGKTARVDATVWASATSFGSDRLDLYYTTSPDAPSWTWLATLTPTAGGEQTLSTTFTLPAGPEIAIHGTFRYGGSAGTCTNGAFDDHDELMFEVQ